VLGSAELQLFMALLFPSVCEGRFMPALQIKSKINLFMKE